MVTQVSQNVHHRNTANGMMAHSKEFSELHNPSLVSTTWQNL